MNKKSIVQTGRSMIEMLGVLAIIGVLSVGGLVGYSKAMERYRVNETINQITHIVQNTRDLFKTQPNYGRGLSGSGTANAVMSNGNFSNRKLADKAKLFPTSLVKNGYKNLFDGEIRFFADGLFSESDVKAFIIAFYGIPQSACIEILTHDWRSNLGLAIIGAIANNTNAIVDNLTVPCTSSYSAGRGYFCNGYMPVTVEQAITICSSEKNNQISWKFY